MIDGFVGEFNWLSNFYLIPIEYEGATYPSTEHAYQAAKTLDQSERKQIANTPSPGKVKRMGMKVTLRPNWENIKLNVMETVLRIKFQDPAMKKLLLETGEFELVEGNNWGDTYWGKVKGKGKNHLGKLLMKIRTELRNA